MPIVIWRDYCLIQIYCPIQAGKKILLILGNEWIFDVCFKVIVEVILFGQILNQNGVKEQKLNKDYLIGKNVPNQKGIKVNLVFVIS